MFPQKEVFPCEDHANWHLIRSPIERLVLPISMDKKINRTI